MEMNAEIGVMQPQAKEPLEPPEARRGRKDSPLEPLEGAWPCPHFDFTVLASKTVWGFYNLNVRPSRLRILLSGRV